MRPSLKFFSGHIAPRLTGNKMKLPDLVAALVAFRAAHGLPYGPADVLACACIMRGQHGEASWLLRFMRAWRYACAVQDAESAVRA